MTFTQNSNMCDFANPNVLAVLDSRFRPLEKPIHCPLHCYHFTNGIFVLEFNQFFHFDRKDNCLWVNDLSETLTKIRVMINFNFDFDGINQTVFRPLASQRDYMNIDIPPLRKLFELFTPDNVRFIYFLLGQFIKVKQNNENGFCLLPIFTGDLTVLVDLVCKLIGNDDICIVDKYKPYWAEPLIKQNHCVVKDLKCIKPFPHDSETCPGFEPNNIFSMCQGFETKYIRRLNTTYILKKKTSFIIKLDEFCSTDIVYEHVKTMYNLRLRMLLKLPYVKMDGFNKSVCLKECEPYLDKFLYVINSAFLDLSQDDRYFKMCPWDNVESAILKKSANSQ